MKFWIETERQLTWLKKFAKKNNLIINENEDIEEKNLPFGVKICGRNNEIYRLGQKSKTADLIPIKNLMLVNDKITFCDSEDGIVGPYDCLFSFEIRDKVRLTNTGKLYTTYARWFIENNIDLKIATRYRYLDDGDNFEDKVGTIVACGPHSKNNPTILYCIEFKSNIGKPVYLVNGDGIVLEDIEE